MDKVDVLIPTRNPSRVNPRLLEVLASAPWVNNVVFETSRPLSVARKIGAMKCKTEWIAMFDDDVVIPPNWFEVVSKFARQPNVVAVSTVRVDDNIHVEALQEGHQQDKTSPHQRNTFHLQHPDKKRSILRLQPSKSLPLRRRHPLQTRQKERKMGNAAKHRSNPPLRRKRHHPNMVLSHNP
ncbi:MAG: glycosyltransferase family A protein [Candidatus Jordarchaeales archaeon]